MLNLAANDILGLMEQHTLSCGGLGGPKVLIFSSSLNLHKRWVNSVEHGKKQYCPKCQLNLKKIRRFTPLIKIILLITFFNYFSANYSQTIEYGKIRRVLLLEKNVCKIVPII